MAAGASLLGPLVTAIFAPSKRSMAENQVLLREKQILKLMSHLLNHE